MSQSKIKQMIIEWPELDVQIRTEFLDDLNPELCAVVQSNLPLETIQSHGVIAGGLLMAPTRILYTQPPRYVEIHEEQPIGRINYSLFYLALSIKYAPIAEHNELSPVAQVLPEDIGLLERAGKRIWDHTCDLSRNKGYIRSIFKLS